MPEKKKIKLDQQLIDIVIYIQKIFRGHMARKTLKAMMDAKFDTMGEDIKNLGSKKMDPTKAKKASDDKDRLNAKKDPK